MLFDIEVLRCIWWGLIGFILIGFAVTDGWDFGAAMLYPLITKTETERRMVLQAVEPFWEGNQVWIILGAGAIFAAWPFVYAVAFSGFYFLILLLLLTMGISRPVSFKYRSKLQNPRWRGFWDRIIVIGGLVPAAIFGILMGNILSGAAFTFDVDLRIAYNGSFADLFHPFPLLCGLTSIFLLTMHGGLYLAMKTEQPVRDRAIRYARYASCLMMIYFAIGGIWVAKALPGYLIVSGGDPHGYSNPLHKVVRQLIGAWLLNYHHHPLTLLAPASGFGGALLAMLTARWWDSRFALICSAISVAGVVSTVGVSMFPFILPSATNFTSSLLVWDASSSELTLLTMLFGAAIFMPIILIYTSWVYHALRGKVTKAEIEHDEHNH